MGTEQRSDARARSGLFLSGPFGGQVSMYPNGSDGRPWNCLRDRDHGDMETYGRDYTNIRDRGMIRAEDQLLAHRMEFAQKLPLG